MKHFWSPYKDKGRIKGFLKSSLPKKKSWGIAQSEQKPVENDDSVSNWTLSLKRTFISTVAGKQYWVLQIQAGIRNDLTRFLRLHGFDHTKIQATRSSFYATRWLRRYLCQQDTALYSQRGTAGCMNIKAAPRIKMGQSLCVTNMPARFVF